LSYRDKSDIFGGPPTPAERRQQLYILWLLPMIVLGTNSVRIARALGFKRSHEIALYGTIFMGVVCIVGAILSYRSARAVARRDLEQLTRPKGR
jgi:hypothetical protein